MRVSGLDKNLDWRFGKGRAAYKRNADAIAQNILTRLRSFLGDWYLDTEAGIDCLIYSAISAPKSASFGRWNQPCCKLKA